MPSNFDAEFASAAGLIVETFGERDERGEPTDAFATSPDRSPGAAPDTWQGIVGPLDVGDTAEDGASGSHEVRNQRQSTTFELLTPLQEILRETKVVIPKYGMLPFNIDSIDRGESFTTLRLSRPLPEYIGRRTTR